MSAALPIPAECCPSPPCPSTACGNPIDLASTVAQLVAASMPFISLKDFGAKGDGITDDTASIQSAVDSGYPAIFVPAGTFIIGSTINITTGDLLLFGISGQYSVNVSCFKAAVAGITLFNITDGEVCFDQICFQGEAVHLQGDGTVNGLLYNTKDADARIDNCSFNNLAKAIQVKGTNCTVYNTLFSSTGYGVVIDKFTSGEARGYIIQDCRFHGMRYTCIVLTAGAAIFNVLIDANLFDGNNICKIIDGEVSDCQITNNHINRCINSAISITNNNAGTATNPPYTNNVGSILIANNTILFLDLFDYGDGIYAIGNNICIRGNSIIGARHFAVRCDSGENCIIDGNQILHSQLHGLILFAMHDTLVKGNVIYDWGISNVVIGGSTDRFGIYTLSTSFNLQIEGNNVRNPAIQAFQIAGMVSPCDKTLFHGNVLDNCQQGIVVNNPGSQPASSVIVNNVFKDCTFGIYDAATTRTHMGNVFMNCGTSVVIAGAAGAGDVISTDPVTLTDLGKVI